MDKLEGFVSRDMYYIAVMIMEGETRVEGCLAFLKMAMRQNEENFARSVIWRCFRNVIQKFV